MDKLNLSYLAGFFDGEGCISIIKSTYHKEWSPQYFLQVSVGQKDAAILDWIAQNCGGKTHLVKRDGSYFWIVANSRAYEFIKLISPFLRYKKPQAELAIKFYQERIIGSKPRNKKLGLSQEELELREEMLLKMKELKRIFVKSSYYK